MIEMKFIWANAAVLIGAAVFVSVRLALLARQRSDVQAIGSRRHHGDLASVLDWKLKVGSHRFPGASGGTCINEAALIAAGFAYRPIRSVDEMPKCFSSPICQLAMTLNDYATDLDRQRLLPYVMRLACADTREVERRRASYINRRTLYGLITPRFERGIKMLDGALAIGRRPDVLEPKRVRTGREAAQVS